MAEMLQYYFENDLGAVYGKTETAFRLWAPTAKAAELCLYDAGDGDCLRERISMEKSRGGTWFARKEGDLCGVYYTFRLSRDGVWCETQDPYSRAVGVNGRRSMVLDLRETDPEGFSKDCGPRPESAVDIVVCEASVADTTARVCGCLFPGKYPGFAQRGLKTEGGAAAGIDHMKELGVTHVQLMPVFDFASIDESDTEKQQYNWGYDPLNYNVPEGSYSTDPCDGSVRIREFKEMVQAIHGAGLGVIMDVVFNHVFDAEQSCFYKTEPDWFFRKNGSAYSNASACGNEVATEHPMVRRYIVDSVCYWASEYHIDGFRFDLMGVMDIDTLNELSVRLREINPCIILYGEGWTGGDSPLPDWQRGLKKNVRLLEGIGMFSDDIRDTIRGHVFYAGDRGYVSGRKNMENSVRYAATAGVWHPQVDYGGYGYTPGGPWAERPDQVVSYASCHDNLTLWDKLAVSCPKSSRKLRYAMNRLAAAMVFTAQGIPFFLQGEEWARTKPLKEGGVAENSYNLPLYTNALSGPVKREQTALSDYYRGLIAFRKAHRGLRLRTAEQIRTCIRFMENTAENLVAFTVSTKEEQLFVAYNANAKPADTELLEGEWELFVDGERAGNTPLGTYSGRLPMQGISCCVLVKRR